MVNPNLKCLHCPKYKGQPQHYTTVVCRECGQRLSCRPDIPAARVAF